MKTKNLLATYALVLVVFFAGCKKDDFEEVVGVCPVVESTSPTKLAVDVPLNQIVTATFNEAMNPLTITTASYMLDGASPVAGTVSYNDRTASFHPASALAPFATYTGTVKSSAKDPRGNALQEDYKWTFKTIPQLTLLSNPVEGGTASGAGTFPQGSLVTVTATPFVGYAFLNWTENGIVVSMNPAKLMEKSVKITVASTSATYQFTMNGNKTLSANFIVAPSSYTLNTTANNGTVAKNPIQATYLAGTTVSLTATPNAGYTFASWSGDATGSTNPLSVTMNSDKNIIANFTAIPPTTYTLNVTANNGTVVKIPNQATYNSGTTLALTATPNSGYTFTSWSGDASGSTNPLSVTMNSNKNITANFTAIPPNTYTLNVIANNGTVVKNPSQATYISGTTVTLTATPNSGYTFTSWSGDAAGSVNPLSVTMNANKNITANFTAIPPTTYTLNVTAVNGTVVKNPSQATYNSGTTVTLTATPNSGYTFTSWTGDATGSTNPLSVIVNANKNITANFTAIPPNTYALNVFAINGTVVKNPSQATYTSGATVTLTATPNSGYTFTSWSGDAMGSTNPLSVTMNTDKNITANFTAIPPSTYTLNVTALNGSVVKNPNQATYSSGATVTLTATPNAGYTFTSWTGDATGSTNPLSVIVNANKNITANFTAIPPSTYTLNVTAINGTVVKNPIQATYSSGATVTLTATPNAGYTFTSWTGDASGSTNPLSVIMNADKNITANFTAIPPSTYTLNVTALNGSVVKNPNQATYSSGATVTLTATPNLGYTFTSWTGDATGSNNPLIVTVNADKNITANFTINTYTLNVTAVNGSVVKNPSQATYNSGANVQLTATPNVGYTFTSWTGDATGSTNPLTVSMNANKNITANFTLIPPSTYTLNVIAINGSVVKNPNLAIYTSGATVILTATPNPGYTFTSWSGDASGSINPLTVNVNADKNITANFTLSTFTLNVTANNGSVLKNPSQATYNSGASVELTATPNSGYIFSSWSGDASGSTNPLTVLMNSNKNITANFTLAPPLGPGAVDLGTAGDFTALSKAGISTTGVTSITGDIGVSPMAAIGITGFGLIMDINGQSSHTPIVVGKVYASDYATPTPAKMTTAIGDMETAFTTANGLTTSPIVELYAGDISGQILPAGLYKWGTGVLISNAGVTLTGGPNDTWVFQIAQDLTVNNSAIVTLQGGAQAKNVFWVVTGETTIGSNANLSGIILCKTLISMNTGASVTGRLLAQTAVTLNASTVVQP